MIDIAGNALTGPFPSELEQLTALINLDLGELCLCMYLLDDDVLFLMC